MTKDHIAQWKTRCSGTAYLFDQAPNVFVASQVDRLRRGQTALAVADGEGRNGVRLAEQGLDVLSTDASSAAQEMARHFGETQDVRLRLERANLSE